MRRTLERIAIVVSLCLLAGAAAESASLAAPADASAYHARCRAAAAACPQTVGDWVGHDVAVPADAEALLRPNVAISREFNNTITGRRASLFIVQCWDVRDLSPHYPPICYPTSRGMEQASSRPREWVINGMQVHGTEYEFRSGDYGSGNSVVVQNFILLPQGQTSADMEPVKKQQAFRDRYYGAGQVQLVFSSSIPAEARDNAMVELMGGYRLLLEAVLTGRNAHHE